MAYTFPGDPNANPVYAALPKSSAAQIQRSSGSVAPNENEAIGFNPAMVFGGFPFTAPNNPFFGG